LQVVAYWSGQTLSKTLMQAFRIILFAAASFVALRLEQLIDPDPRFMGKRARITPRELAVLRLVLTGRQTAEIAKALELREETVRSHLKKAQGKLGARNRTQAVAEAIRQQLIPCARASRVRAFAAPSRSQVWEALRDCSRDRPALSCAGHADRRYRFAGFDLIPRGLAPVQPPAF
jgi:DNA-binding CsgD family transcriptional regulator